MNNTFQEIGRALNGGKNILLFPHINADGDAIGSCVAICKALRVIGKKAYILLEEELPENLRFLDDVGLDTTGEVYTTYEKDIFKGKDYISMCIDCGDLGRFPERSEVFKGGKLKICLDHHASSQPVWDLNYIDSKAAATGVLAFKLLKEFGLGVNLEDNFNSDRILLGQDDEIGKAIFVAITTDTGNFQYSNTNQDCHKIMAEIYSWGTELSEVSNAIYQSIRMEKFLVTNEALGSCKIISSDNTKYKGAIAYLSKETQEKIGSKPSETDDVIDYLRSIKDVEYAAFLKEKEPSVIRVSFRAKSKGNVVEIAKKYEGGGHIKAAGCTLYMSLEEAVKIITKDIEEALKNI